MYPVLDKDGVDILLSIPLAKILGYYMWNKYNNILNGQEKIDQVGNLGLREQYGSEFLEFSLCLIYLELDVREAATQNTNRCRIYLFYSQKPTLFRQITRKDVT